MRDPIRTHFDSLAERWDELAIHPRERVQRVLDALGDIAGLSVLDVGSGTGVLIEPLLERVGPSGSVLALDLSPRMIEVAKGKRFAVNLEFAVADFLLWDPPAKFDLVVAYSCYPHFLDQSAFWLAARRSLAEGGRILVAHIEGREAINALHGGFASSLSRSLGPVAELARLAASFGFQGETSLDDGEYYLLSAYLKVQGQFAMQMPQML